MQDYRLDSRLLGAAIVIFFAGAAHPIDAQPAGGIYTTSCFESCFIGRTNLDGTNRQTIATDTGVSLAVDVVNARVYFTRPSTTIRRCSVDGTAQEAVLSDLGHVGAITVDPYGGKLYFEESTPDEEVLIRRANLDGTALETIGSTGIGLQDLEVDPIGQKIYWAHIDALTYESSVSRANLDGSEVEVLLTQANVDAQFFPLGVAVDPTEKIYISDRGSQFGSPGTGRVLRANLDGSGWVTIVDATDIPDLSTWRIAVGQYVYFLGRNDEDHGVFRSNGDGSQIALLVSQPNGSWGGHADIALDTRPGGIVVPATSAWGAGVLVALSMLAAAMTLLARRKTRM